MQTLLLLLLAFISFWPFTWGTAKRSQLQVVWYIDAHPLSTESHNETAAREEHVYKMECSQLSSSVLRHHVMLHLDPNNWINVKQVPSFLTQEFEIKQNKFFLKMSVFWSLQEKKQSSHTHCITRSSAADYSILLGFGKSQYRSLCCLFKDATLNFLK